MDEEKKEEELLRHILGADNRYSKRNWGFRNRFCTHANDPDFTELQKMERKNLVKSYNKPADSIFPTMVVFSATKKGALEIGFKSYQLKKAGLL